MTERIEAPLSIRMKKYEDVNRYYLPSKQPVIIRVDGKAFHSYTKQSWCERPFSDILVKTFQQTTIAVCEQLMNCCIAYHQSDEVTFFLKDYERIEQQQLFAGNIQKISSTIASKFTAYFNKYMIENLLAANKDISKLKLAEFDARCYTVPLHEVINCFIWRQRDAMKNSVSQYADSFFSSKQLHKKNTEDKKQLIRDTNKGDWDSLPLYIQRGTFFKKIDLELPLDTLSEQNLQYYIDNNLEIPDTIIRKKWIIDLTPPIVSDTKNYIEQIVYEIDGGYNELIPELNKK